jgi:hypothetical protein
VTGDSIVTCQPFVGLRNGAWLGNRPVNNSSAQPRWRHPAARALPRQRRCKHGDVTQPSPG